MARAQREPAWAPRSLALDELERWDDHGATWRVVELAESQATLELCTCFGEPVETVRGEDPALIAYVRRHRHG